MVEMHNGRVRVANNDPGPGVTVELSLPPAELTRDTERLRQDAAERP
jgi:hypothetical protein